MDTIQMDLFGETGIDISTNSKKPTPLVWSFSKRGMLEQCPRRYYYQYYGSNKNTAKNDPQKEKLRFLKKLQNRHLRTGDILHYVIRWYLKKLQEGEHLSPDWLLQWALNDFRKEVKFSQQYKRGTPLPDEEYPPNLLLEFYYGQSDAESLCIESEERIIKALTNFAKSQNFAQFREGVTDPSALIEESARMNNDYFTLSGKVDLVYREGDKYVIVDWKTGGSNSSDDSLQMLAYALWAKHKFECPLDTITLHRVYLEDNTFSTFHVGEKGIARVEARILQDLERMHEVDNYGKQGLVEAFTPCAQPKVCKLCQFQEVCPKE
jgi:ATP-dependent exoDNAse (exonuclease V) beta subunit